MKTSQRSTLSALALPLLFATSSAFPLSRHPLRDTTTSSSSSSPPYLNSSSPWSCWGNSTNPTDCPPKTFNPESGSNVAVYYGQAPYTLNVSLTTVCADPNVDIIILAFITEFFAAGGYPQLNVGNNCAGPTTAQTSAGATDLLDCVVTGLAAEVAQCQALGKKVMISTGGAASGPGSLFPSEVEAEQAAQTLWSLFLGGQDDELIRPFGNVTLDGIDIDNEIPSDEYYDVFISSLRSIYNANPGRDYYLSAAPQCFLPSASIPLTSMQNQLDFLFIQFYDNPSCDFTTEAGFLNSVQTWSELVAPSPGNITAGGVVPKMFIGASAVSAIFSGYVDVSDYKDLLGKARALNITNLGGAMFWDGAWGETSMAANGETFMQAAKSVLS